MAVAAVDLIATAAECKGVPPGPLSGLKVCYAPNSITGHSRRSETGHRTPKLSIDSDLGLQEDVAGGVAEHDLVGAGDHFPAVAEDVPVGEGALVQG